MNAITQRLRKVSLLLAVVTLSIGTGCDAALQNASLDAVANSVTTLVDALVNAVIHSLEKEEPGPVNTV